MAGKVTLPSTTITTLGLLGMIDTVMSVDHSRSRLTVRTPGIACPSVMVRVGGPNTSFTGVVATTSTGASVGDALSMPASGTPPPAPPAPIIPFAVPPIPPGEALIGELQPDAKPHATKPTRTSQSQVR